MDNMLTIRQRGREESRRYSPTELGMDWGLKQERKECKDYLLESVMSPWFTESQKKKKNNIGKENA